MECKNCGILHEGKYCNECGQKVITRRITLRNLLHDLWAIFTNVEKGFWYTFKMLFANPGVVLRKYLDGQTVRFYNPLRYLLLWVAISVAIVLATGLYDRQQESIQVLTPYSQKTEVAALQQKMQKEAQAEMKKYLNFLPLAILPFMGLASFWVFRRRGLNYAEHLVINAYAYGQTTAIGTAIQLVVLGVPALLPFLPLKILLLNIVYFAHVFRSFFGIRTVNATLRATLTTMLGFGMSILFFGIIGIFVGIFLYSKMKNG